MRRFFRLALLLFFGPASALPAASPALDPATAAGKVGETVIMEGTVAGAFRSRKSSPNAQDNESFLHFGDAYPRHLITVRYNANKTTDLRGVINSAFIGRKVRVTGRVEKGRSVPLIYLSSRDQIELLPVDESILKRIDLDGKADRSQFAQAWRQKLQRREFADLEAAAKKFRGEKTLDGAGGWLLSYFYDGMYAEIGSSPEAKAAHLALLEEWVRQYPASITARVALAAWWIQDAHWLLNDLPDFDDRVKLIVLSQHFRDSKAEAQKIMAEAAGLEEKCPQYYRILQRIHFWDASAAETQKKLFQEAVAFEPAFREYYIGQAAYLLVFGEEGDWEKFALAQTESGRPDDLVLYAWLVWGLALDYYDESIFTHSSADWERVSRGFQQMRQIYPDSKWILNWYAQLAGQANDPRVANQLLPELKPKVDMSAWYSWSNFEFFLKWCASPGGAIWF